MLVNLNNLEPRLNKAAFQMLTQWWIDKKIDSQELKVIGRWALDYPKTMEALDASELHTLALPQAEMELEILQSKEAKDKLAQGLTEMEIMREAEIDLEFYLIKAPKLSNPKFRQALEEDLRYEEELEDEMEADNAWTFQVIYRTQNEMRQLIEEENFAIAKKQQQIAAIAYSMGDSEEEKAQAQQTVETLENQILALKDKVYLQLEPLDKKLEEMTKGITSEKAFNKLLTQYRKEAIQAIQAVK